MKKKFIKCRNCGLEIISRKRMLEVVQNFISRLNREAKLKSKDDFFLRTKVEKDYRISIYDSMQITYLRWAQFIVIQRDPDMSIDRFWDVV